LQRHEEQRHRRPGSAGGSDGQGLGGGLYIDVGAVVTATNIRIKKNTNSTAGGDIYGTLS
jgi:hypothetical protein